MFDVHDPHPISHGLPSPSRLLVRGATAASCTAILGILIVLQSSSGAEMRSARDAASELLRKLPPPVHLVIHLDELNPDAGGQAAPSPARAAEPRAENLAMPALAAAPIPSAPVEERAPELPSVATPAPAPPLPESAGKGLGLGANSGAGLGAGTARGVASLQVLRQVTPYYYGVGYMDIPAGWVQLRVTLDEAGVPVKAVPVSGDPRLWPESVKAAMKWRWGRPDSIGLKAPLELTLSFNFAPGR